VKKVYFLYAALLITLISVLLVYKSHYSTINNEIDIKVKGQPNIGCLELFINNNYDKSYTKCDYKEYKINNLPDTISSIRLDLGDKKGSIFTIEKIIFKNKDKIYKEIKGTELTSWTSDQVIINKEGVAQITDTDPKIYGKVDVKFENKKSIPSFINFSYMIIVFFIIFLNIKNFKNLKLKKEEKDNLKINLVLITMFFLILLSSFPGHTNFDEFYMLTQYYNFNMDGLQPPLHTILWANLINISESAGLHRLLSVGSIMVLQLLVYLFALKKILESINNNFLKYLLLITLTILPISLVSLGHTGKDTQMLIAFFAAFTVLKLYEKKPNVLILVISLVLIFYGSFVRSNGIAGGIVLIFYWTHVALYNGGEYWNKNYKKIILTISISTILISCNINFTQKIIKNHCCDSMQIIMTPIYDLMGMSVRLNENLVPRSMYTDEYSIEDLKKYYNIYDLDWTGLKMGSYKLLPEILNHWAIEIEKHPKEYLQHRFDVLINFFGFYYGKPKYPYFLGFYINTKIAGSNDEISKIIKSYEDNRNYLEYQHIFYKYYSIGSSFLYRYIVYFLLAIFTYYIVLKKKIKIPISTNVIFASGFLYSAPYVILANSSHFRYILWSCFAFFIASILNIDLIYSNKNEKNN
jgi:hypothetical protein